MGLLDGSFNLDDPQTQGLLASAAAMLNASGPSRMPVSLGQVLGQGFLGYQSGKKQALDQQMENMKNNLLVQQVAQATRKNKLVNDSMQALMDMAKDGTNPAPIALAQGAQAGDIGPTNSNAARLSALPQQTPGMVYGVPVQAMLQDYATNDGKNIGEWMYKRLTPDIQVSNGYAYDKNRMAPGFLPQLNVSQNGQATQVLIGDDGLPVVSAPTGALSTYKGYQGAAKQAENENTLAPLDRVNPVTGRPYTGTIADLINASRPQVGAQTSPPPDNTTSYSSNSGGLDVSKLSPQMQAFLQKANPQAYANGVASFQRNSISQAASASGFNGFAGPADLARDQADVRAQTEPIIKFNTERINQAHTSNQKVLDNLSDTVRNEAELVNRNNNILPLLDKIQTGGFMPEQRIQLANSINTSGLPDSVKSTISKWVANGDPTAGKVIENQLAAAGIKTMLDTLDKEGKPNRAIFEAVQRAQESVNSGNPVLKDIFALQKQLYDWHYQQHQNMSNAMAAQDYNPLTLQAQMSNARNDSLNQPRSGTNGTPSNTANILTELPTANKSNMGKIAVDHDTGKRYKSNGLQWVEIK